jgi:hypothetical protein
MAVGSRPAPDTWPSRTTARSPSACCRTWWWGGWHYLEHDWSVSAGDYAFEPNASCAESYSLP